MSFFLNSMPKINLSMRFLQAMNVWFNLSFLKTYMSISLVTSGLSNKQYLLMTNLDISVTQSVQNFLVLTMV